MGASHGEDLSVQFVYEYKQDIIFHRVYSLVCPVLYIVSAHQGSDLSPYMTPIPIGAHNLKLIPWSFALVSASSSW